MLAKRKKHGTSSRGVARVHAYVWTGCTNAYSNFEPDSGDILLCVHNFERLLNKNT